MMRICTECPDPVYCHDRTGGCNLAGIRGATDATSEAANKVNTLYRETCGALEMAKQAIRLAGMSDTDATAIATLAGSILMADRFDNLSRQLLHEEAENEVH